jgi:16S rRNA (uracil1498-N3)-methyltransferase
MTAPLFFVDSAALAGDRVVVDGAEGRHAADVRRLHVGELVDVGDGCGRVAHGVVAEVARGRIVVDVQGMVDVAPASPRFVVVQALAKGGRDLDAVEAMTEVGVDEIVAWTAERSVAKPTDRTLVKWSATAREAAKQSRRAWIPQVTGPLSTPEVSARIASASLAVVLHEAATEPLAVQALPEAGDVLLVVGPEGGLSADEVTTSSDAGAHVCRLGDGVLRTSTAGVAALSVLSAASRWRESGPPGGFGSRLSP